MAKTNCPNIAENEQRCTCPAVDCERHGVCCECLSSHMERDSLPSCVKVRIQENPAFREGVAGLVNQANSSN